MDTEINQLLQTFFYNTFEYHGQKLNTDDELNQYIEKFCVSQDMKYLIEYIVRVSLNKQMNEIVEKLKSEGTKPNVTKNKKFLIQQFNAARQRLNDKAKSLEKEIHQLKPEILRQQLDKAQEQFNSDLLKIDADRRNYYTSKEQYIKAKEQFDKTQRELDLDMCLIINERYDQIDKNILDHVHNTQDRYEEHKKHLNEAREQCKKAREQLDKTKEQYKKAQGLLKDDQEFQVNKVQEPFDKIHRKYLEDLQQYINELIEYDDKRQQKYNDKIIEVLMNDFDYYRVNQHSLYRTTIASMIDEKTNKLIDIDYIADSMNKKIKAEETNMFLTFLNIEYHSYLTNPLIDKLYCTFIKRFENVDKDKSCNIC